METLIVNLENKKQLTLLKAMLTEMRIKYKSSKAQSNTFSANLKTKIEDAREEKRIGKLTTIKPGKVWESI